jgi:hypothetical protein
MERSQRRQAEAIQDAFVILRKRQFLTQRLNNMAKTKMTNEKLEEMNHIRRQLHSFHVPMYTLQLIFKIFQLHGQLKNLKSRQSQKGFRFFKTKDDWLLDEAVKNTMKKLDSL